MKYVVDFLRISHCLTILMCVFVFCVSEIALADELLDIRCTSPNGTRYSIEPNEKKVTAKKDGYSGVTPRFIFDPSDPGELVVIWGWSKKFGSNVPDKPSKAKVIRASENRITAIEVTSSEEWTYSFYPEQEIGLFTRHANLFAPLATVFHSTCSFSPGLATAFSD